MKKQKNNISVASQSAKKAKPFKETVVNVCGPSNSGKTTGITGAARYFAKNYPKPKMTALQKLVYGHLNPIYIKECFEVSLVNGKRVGFFSKGDFPEYIAMTHLLISIFKCDIAVAASHPPNSVLLGYLEETAHFHGMRHVVITPDLPFDPKLAEKIIAQVKYLTK